ncbi:hypothetical protein FYJ43_01870 [Cutibacterium sp. WCA-380-WT-3A]|uniref:Uncharacterized protein n=1 Tax=Cutibacterium porci TaxID=2605781 RepID=A0A7K0J4I0_9ACTN|nr:hypothetical protein [Cutibacterium porci]
MAGTLLSGLIGLARLRNVASKKIKRPGGVSPYRQFQITAVWPSAPIDCTPVHVVEFSSPFGNASCAGTASVELFRRSGAPRQ